MPEPVAVVSVAEMRSLEAAAIEAGTPERVLQERAGLVVADVIEAELGARPADGQSGRPPRIVVLAGSGNNGRDAVVAGRRLQARGCAVEIWHGSRNPLSATELEDIAAEGIRIQRYDGDRSPQHLEAALGTADIMIDGLLGVGSRGPMRPEQARVAGALNLARRRTHGPKIVAVDVPSGIDADDGSVPGVAVHADITVTFGAVKAGLLRFPAASYAGRLEVGRIGLRAAHADACTAKILDADRVRRFVPQRAADAHKYRVGRVLLVAGFDQYVGAACLGAEAAARVGAGLIGLVSTEAVKHVLATRLPEATYPLTLTNLEARPEAAAEAVAALLPEQQALLIGPGIGRSETTEQFLRLLLVFNARQERPTPAVIDADALTLLAGWPRWWEQIGQGNVLTPHAGEMARLLASDPDIGARGGESPWDTARRAAERWHQVIVLKGPFTCVAKADDAAWIYPYANPALATAGTGDVLAGLTAGLLAQGLGGAAAAQLAVVTHARAARCVTARLNGQTLLASDLPAAVPGVLSALAAGHERPW